MNIFRVAVCIQAHKDPNKVDILISSLTHETIDIFLFIDKKSSIDDFLFLKEKYNIYLNKCDINVFWSGYSQVQNTLNSFQYILSINNYSHIIHLSGECMLVKPINQLLEYIKQNNKSQFISLFDLDSEWDFSERFRRLYFPDFRSTYLRKFLKLFFFFYKKEKYILDKCYGGSCWFALTVNCVKYILDYVETHPQFVEFHKYTVCADEFFIHSIIGNSQFMSDVRPYLHYIDWSEKRSSPKYLLKADSNQIISSNKFFCRKASIELMEMFYILNKKKDV